MDLFCNNFILEVKSTYSVFINEEDGKVKRVNLRAKVQN